MSGSPRSLASSVINHRRHVPPGAVASYREAPGIQAMFLPESPDPPRRRVALLKGNRVAHFRAEPVHREDDGGLGSDRQFAHQPVMRLRTAADPPSAMNIQDDWQWSLRVLGPQNTQRYLRAGTIGNRQVFNVDHRLANIARLDVIESEPSLVGAKREQQRGPGSRLGKGVRLGFKLNPVGHGSGSSMTPDSAQHIYCTRTFLSRSPNHLLQLREAGPAFVLEDVGHPLLSAPPSVSGSTPARCLPLLA